MRNIIKFNILILCLSLVSVNSIFAQETEVTTEENNANGTLIVQHNFKNRARSFEAGDRIDLLLVDGKRFKGRVAGVTDESLTINTKLSTEEIAITDISAIIYNNTFVNKFLAGTFATTSITALASGLGLVGYGIITYTQAEQASAFEFSSRAAQDEALTLASYGGVAILGSAVLFGAYHLVKRKKYDLRKNWNIRVVE